MFVGSMPLFALEQCRQARINRCAIGVCLCSSPVLEPDLDLFCPYEIREAGKIGPWKEHLDLKRTYCLLLITVSGYACRQYFDSSSSSIIYLFIYLLIDWLICLFMFLTGPSGQIAWQQKVHLRRSTSWSPMFNDMFSLGPKGEGVFGAPEPQFFFNAEPWARSSSWSRHTIIIDSGEMTPWRKMIESQGLDFSVTGPWSTALF